MSDYTADYIDIVADYWYDGKIIDRYSTAEYNKIIYPEYEKGAILRNERSKRETNQKRSSARLNIGGTHQDGSIGIYGVYSNDGRARKGNGELRGSGISQGVKYALSTDSNNAELDDYV